MDALKRSHAWTNEMHLPANKQTKQTGSCSASLPHADQLSIQCVRITTAEKQTQTSLLRWYSTSSRGIPHPCHVTQNEKCRYKSHFRHTVHPPKSCMSTQREGNYFYIVFLLAILSRRVYWINSGNTWFFRLRHFVMRLTSDSGRDRWGGGGAGSFLRCAANMPWNRPRFFPPVPSSSQHTK